MNYIAILLGGGIGSLARFILSKLISRNFYMIFPIGTFVVNMIGCLAIGFLFAIFERFIISQNMRLFIFTGFLGGFTTFSSFGLETANLIRDSEISRGLLNIAISNILGITMVFTGMFLANLLLKKIG